MARWRCVWKIRETKLTTCLGHSYVVSGTLELYLHPFPLLVEVVRKALTTVKVSLVCS